MSILIWKRFSEETRYRITEYLKTKRDNISLKNDVMDNLNRILEDPTFYDATFFSKEADLYIDEGTRCLASKNPNKELIARLNRRILDQNYPEEIEDIRYIPYSVIYYDQDHFNPFVIPFKLERKDNKN